ncbi:MAG: FAD-dependent oxidoreductase [Actinomyces sp.]|nr:FAD-dependent oxidoreductase [Actinomyces sp.]MDN6565648.1 FAD-dependent oxidoreductase [Actinomyces sp.]MDN6793638.1 FAD-dependent oxidoreductase [Propionibacterium sp.]
MSEEEDVDFDVIVVGAGPAGSVAAALLARAGRQVVLIERGETPGSKNLSGGVLYGRVLDSVFPGWLDEAPVERIITRNVIIFLTETGKVAVDAVDPALGEPVNAVTVLRAKFDAWLAEQAEAEGAFLMPGVKVDELLTEKTPEGSTRVVGVRAGEDELHARVVVLADGVNSFLARQAGLRTKPRTNEQAVGVKAVIQLDEQVLQDRFGVDATHGAAHALVGECTQGVGGGGFMYTNKDSVSIGLVLRLDDLLARHQDAVSLFESFLAHPAIAPFLEGGEMVEYGSHLVNEGGLAMVGEIHGDGYVIVGDAAGLTLNTGLTVRGMDLAIGSGRCAARAIGEALDKDDVSAQALARYRQLLDSSFVGADMRTYAKAPAFLERPRMYTEYGPLLADVLHRAFDLDTAPREHLLTTARRALKNSPVKMRELVSDALAGVKAL